MGFVLLAGTPTTTCASPASSSVWERWATPTTRHHSCASFWRRLSSTELSRRSRTALSTTSCLPSLTKGSAGSWSGSPIPATTARTSSSGAPGNFRRCGPSPRAPKPKRERCCINAVPQRAFRPPAGAFMMQPTFYFRCFSLYLCLILFFAFLNGSLVKYMLTLNQ